MPGLVQDVSFTSIATSDADRFNQTVAFYARVGFRLTKSYNKSRNDTLDELGPVLARALSRLGISNDSILEAWLEAFPPQPIDRKGDVVPFQECAAYTGDSGKQLGSTTVLKVRLVTGNLATAPCQVNFFTPDLKGMKQILGKAAIDVSEHSVSAIDPLGNKVTFTDFETPFSKESFSSSEQYLEAKTVEILKSLPHTSASVPANAASKAQTPKKKKIAVMTSGGDAPGMNPAVRAVVRAGIFMDCDVFAVYEGYEGLVAGGDLLKQMEWSDVRNYLSLGGTNIGTARCPAFRERKGRLTGTYNMIVNGIDALIVCGGDGLLTGADLFRSEWPSLVEELVKTKRLTAEQAKPYRKLTIVGLVGSIDNDMCSTDATIGAYSSLERITEMVDYIDATAQSHSRAFVVEVMGRHCGWLALMLGLATGADFIFIPERPPKAGEWAAELKKVCSRHREKGKRNTTVIIAEGAIDNDLNPISANQVKDVLVELGLDTRITTLGHVQRGGTAVAYDRLLATMQGVEAVKAVLDTADDQPLPMIGVLNNQIVRVPLVDAVRLTLLVATAIEAKDFDKAMSLRDSSFAEAYQQFLLTAIHDDGKSILPEQERLNIGIVHVGASLLGLNAVTRAAALYCLSKGHRLFAIQNGFAGLIEGNPIKELSWFDVEGWHNRGGSEIGTNRLVPSEDFGKVAYHFQEHNIQGLLLAGGFEAFTALHELDSHKEQYPVFGIPKVVVPATVSNNVPGTEYSLGSDTCLNQLVNYCDAILQSASLSRRRVFVVEVQGGNVGYVASYCGLITGAMLVYTPEKKIDLALIQQDIGLLYESFADDRGQTNNGKLVIRNEQASRVYTTELVADIMHERAQQRFETRTAIPGHVQQGYTPSSMDRVEAVRFAVKAVQHIEAWSDRVCEDVEKKPRVGCERGSSDAEEKPLVDSGSAAVVIGIRGLRVALTDVHHLYENDTDTVLRKGNTIHWEGMTAALDMLSGRALLQRQSVTLKGI